MSLQVELEKINEGALVLGIKDGKEVTISIGERITEGGILRKWLLGYEVKLTDAGDVVFCGSATVQQISKWVTDKYGQ